MLKLKHVQVKVPFKGLNNTFCKQQNFKKNTTHLRTVERMHPDILLIETNVFKNHKGQQLVVWLG